MISFGTLILNLPEGIFSGKVKDKNNDIVPLLLNEDGYARKFIEAVLFIVSEMIPLDVYTPQPRE